MKAFWVSDCEVWAANDAEEAKADYLATTGVQADPEYFGELSDDALDQPFPDTDEDERPTGEMTSIREQLRGCTGPGFVAGTDS